jgi:hypothetical protein
MSRQQSRQPFPSRSQQDQRPLDSPYLTSHEAVIYLRLSSLSALYELEHARRRLEDALTAIENARQYLEHVK